jgi:predicted nucleic acid-binding protein
MYVVDASVAVKWIAPERMRDHATALLEDLGLLEAPDLILAEVANAVSVKRRRGEMTREEADAGLEAVQNFIRVFHPSRRLSSRALEIAFDLDHPVYDCVYLACAEAEGGTLVTADTKLLRVVRGSEFAMLVRSLAEIPGEGS